jgi:hypothetical protein
MGARVKPKYAAGLNSALFKALSHPVQYRIVMIAGEREVTPTELAEMLDEPLSRIYPQVRALESADLLELVDTDTRLGGTMHYYRAVMRPVVETEAWDELPLIAREATTAVNTGVVIGEIAASVRAGRFDTHPSRAILRRPIKVDKAGARRIEQALIAIDSLCAEAELESAERVGPGDDDGRIDMLAATFLFHRAND